MGVTACVYCRDCGQSAPGIGDCGAVGFPSLANTSRTIAGYQTFGYLHAAFKAIGYHTWELEAIAAYLKIHKGHDVTLYLEGQDVRTDEEADLETWSDDRFAYDEDGFVSGFYDVTCDKCGDHVRYGPVQLRDMAPLKLTTPRIDKFLERVRGAEGRNFHRVFLLLDYHREQEAFAGFLTKHQGHAPVARIVREESWRAAGAPAPRWELAWQKPHELTVFGEPLIAGNRIFVVDGVKHPQSSKAPTVHCYSLDGEVLWEREHPHNISNRPAWTAGGVVVERYVNDGPHRYELVWVDPDNGGVVRSTTTRHGVDRWLPGHRQFVGFRSMSGAERDEKRVAVVDASSGESIWESQVPNDIKLLPPRCCVAGDAVLLVGNWRDTPIWVKCFDSATGAERWAVTLSAPVDCVGTDYVAWKEFLLVRVGLRLFALNVADGAIAWQLDAPFTGWSESQDLLIGHRDHPSRFSRDHFGVIDLEQRKQRFLLDEKDFASAPQPPPRLSTKAHVSGGEILVVDERGRRLWGLDAMAGKPVWMHRPTEGVAGQRPAFSGDHLVIQGPTLTCYKRTR